MSDVARVGIVAVSHSERIALGVVELAAQMAPSVALEAAGGTDEGGIGTSFGKVQDALASADAGAGVVVLCDLGSAVLTAETALDFLDDEQRARTRVVDAPLVEGSVAAAVAAESGASLEEVERAARSAGGAGDTESGGTGRPDQADGSGGSGGTLRRTVTLVNRDGLHARPAAELVKLASTFDARVTVQGKDAKSLLAIMGLGLTRGAEVTVEAQGAEAPAALEALSRLIEEGFGEA